MLPNYHPTSLYLALWPTPDFDFPDDVAELARRIRAVFPVFQQEQQVQSADGSPLPTELPRLILIGANGQWVLELAPAKINFRLTLASPLVVQAPEGQTPPHAVTAAFLLFRQQLAPLHAWLAENLGCKVYRIGLITQLFCELRSSANQRIAEYFLHPRALQNQPPHEIQLNLHSRLALPNGPLVNRWLRVRPLRTRDARHVDFASQIEIDINTMAEDTAPRGARDLSQFVQSVEQHITQELPVLHDADFAG